MGVLDTASNAKNPILRVVLASRMQGAPAAESLSQIAREQSVQNHARGVTGALVAFPTGFLYWLEAPGSQLCERIPQLIAAPWFGEGELVAIGWTAARRFARRSMPYMEAPAGLGLPAQNTNDRTATLETALRAFDQIAQSDGGLLPGPLLARVPEFVAALCAGGETARLPEAGARDLRLRAAFVEACLAHMAQMRAQQSLDSAQIMLALTHLNGLWQRQGRLAQPAQARGQVCLVLPPGETELIGVKVKADLLRAAGFCVRVVLEETVDATLSAVRACPDALVLVAGPRVAPDLPGGSADQLAAHLRDACPGRHIWLGGHRAGPLSEVAQRLNLIRHRAEGMALSEVDWGGIGSLVQLMEVGPGNGGLALNL
ncbi:hypothetical protein CKO11_04665 [Rhodobacter sp. TJ_12]|uniref:hypothetical protein n=1 Tax=Rhodobacter sp. TJ_12 TaxID=2029399 RepID=UPI001CC073B2|nr:hypothetical protein [Rhodobacter sp. TJ_12]MBZ4021751.1 hypothetical protein [Rhodobacter sp. TJ_12]